MAVLLAAVAPLVSSFLHVDAALIWAASIGIPFGVTLPLIVGVLQGEQRFTGLSTILFGQAALKLLAGVGLGSILGPVGMVLGISLASAASFVIGAYLVRNKLGVNPRWPWFSPAIKYLAVVLPSTIALSILLSADILVVKHFFSAKTSGEYSAVAALGRAVFYAATGVAAVLFPKVVFREARGNSGAVLVSLSVSLVALGGLVSLAGLALVGRAVLTMFAGRGYGAEAFLLPPYALAMTILGCVAVFVARHQSSGNPMFLGVLLPAAIFLPGLLVVFHGSLIQVVQVMGVCFGILAVCLMALMVVQERGRTGLVSNPGSDLVEAELGRVSSGS